MKQSHLLKVDPCPTDHGLRYIVVRERKHGYSIILYEVLTGVKHPKLTKQKWQFYKVLAFIPKIALNAHAPGNNELKNLDYYKKIVLEHTREELNILTRIEKVRK